MAAKAGEEAVLALANVRATARKYLDVLTRRVVHAADGWLASECGVAPVVVVAV